MASSDLDAFLGGPEPAPAPEAPPPDKPEPDAAPAAPEPAPEGDDDDDTAVVPTSADGRTVPLEALAAERARRRDWKSQAVAAETALAELRKQFEEAKRQAAAPPPPPPQQFQPPPLAPLTPEEIQANPMAVLERAQYVAALEREARWSDKLDLSEEALRDKIGDEEVDRMQADWKVMVAENPSLVAELRKERNPYKAAHKKVEAWRAQREMGDDPAAWRAKLEAELRQKWEAELLSGPEAQSQPQSQRPAAAPKLAPSLATARSAAPRGNTGFSGPMSLDDILAGRKG